MQLCISNWYSLFNLMQFMQRWTSSAASMFQMLYEQFKYFCQTTSLTVFSHEIKKNTPVDLKATFSLLCALLYYPVHSLLSSMNWKGGVWHINIEDDIFGSCRVSEEPIPPSKQSSEFCSWAQIPIYLHISWLDGGVEVLGNYRLVRMKDGRGECLGLGH